jgi:excisionase family DNA binding protein
MHPATYPPTVSVEHAARILGISRSSGYRGIHRGDIPALRIGGRLKVPTAPLLAMLGLDPTTMIDPLWNTTG